MEQGKLRRLWDRVSDRLFAEREVWLRSRGQLRYVKVSPRLQKRVAALALMAVAWGGFVNADWLLRGERLQAWSVEYRQQAESYARLVQAATAYQVEVADALSRMEAAVQTADRGAGESVLEVQLARTTLARVELARQVAALPATPAAGQSVLGERLAALQAALRLDATAAEAAQDLLSARLDRSESALVAAQAARGALQDQLTALLARLREQDSARSQLLATQADLNARIAELQRQAAAASVDKSTLQFRIASLESALSQSLSEADNLMTERDALKSQIATLQAAVTEVQRKQRGMADRVALRALDSLAQIEATIAATGLDVAAVLAEADATRPNEGGPFIPAAVDASDPLFAIDASVAMLDRQLDRWETLSRVAAALPVAAPIENVELRSGFGYRKDPINGRSAFHSGLDFDGPVNTPLYSTAPGVVTFAGWRGRYGRVVEIDHGFGIVTRYAHLKKISVEEGQVVDLGDSVGTLGSSGRTTGPHLHYEILFKDQPLDPLPFIEAGRNVL